MVRKLVLAVVGAALVVAGCEVTVSFTPLGSDFSVSGNWTVGGATPTAASCTASGIAFVRLAFVDAGGTYTYSDLTFPCASGSFSTAPILGWGTYTTVWQAVDASKNIIGSSGAITWTVDYPTTSKSFDAVDFGLPIVGFDPHGTDAELAGDWLMDGAAPDAATCAAAGVAEVAIVLYDSGDSDFSDPVEMGRAACSAGKFDSAPDKILAYGSYLAGHVAYGADSAEVVRDEATTFVVASPTTRASLAQINFTTVPATSLDVTIGWDTDPSDVMVDADCATAGVVTMSYQLGTDHGIHDEATDVACQNQLMWDDISPGTYSLYMEGANASGAKLWMATCDMLVVESGVEMYNCFVDMM